MTGLDLFALDPVPTGVLRAAGVLLFASAAIHKLRDPVRFRAALAGHGLLPEPLRPAAARAIPLLELAIAFGIVVPASSGVACVAGAALLAGYALVLARSLARGRRDLDCGCQGWGSHASGIDASLVARNAVLVALLLAAARSPLPRSLVWLDGVTIAAGALTLAVLYAAADLALANRRSLAS